MKIYGYKKEELDLCSSPSELREASVQCSVEELKELMLFLTEAYEELKDYSFPYGCCTLQFRDWSHNWKSGDSDFVVVVERS